MPSTEIKAAINFKQMLADQQASGFAPSEDGPSSKKAPKKSQVKPLSLERYGLATEAQWLLTVPSRYEDYQTFTDDFDAILQGSTAMVRGKVVSKAMFAGAKKRTINPRDATYLVATIENKRGQRIDVSAFGKPGFAWMPFVVGTPIVVRGTAKLNHINNLSLAGVEIVPSNRIGAISPVYPNIKITKGDRFAERVVANYHLLDTAAHLVEIDTGWSQPMLRETLCSLTDFDNAKQLLSELHRPSSVKRGQQAQRAAKLLSAWGLVRTTNKRIHSVEVNPRSIVNISDDQVEALIKQLPMRLTNDQAEAIAGICQSLRSPLPMSGLLTGDVGSGKTLSFLVPMVATHHAGKKAMLMTPNNLLIQQVAQELAHYFPDDPVCTVTGAKGAGKGGIQGDPNASIVIGNTALLHAMQKGKLGSMPDFLVVDEQHKFSVQQRQALMADHTNSLESTATPIPRTAALAFHGAKDLFMLRQVPVKKTIASRLANRSHAKEVHRHVLEALNRGEQAAVIYPLLASEDPTHSLKTVGDAASNWSKSLPLQEIAVLHGKMQDEEKVDILNQFRSQKKKLLLASIVIEVGVTLPELKTMLVIGAEQFGVVTLHQLRGRLARHGGHGDFILFSESDQPEALERLRMVVDHSDGFELAENDAKKRGYGDILGRDDAAQSGKTKTLFLGVDLKPNDLSFAIRLHQKLHGDLSAPMESNDRDENKKTISRPM